MAGSQQALCSRGSYCLPHLLWCLMLPLLLCCRILLMVTPQSRCVKLFLMVDQVAWPWVRHLHACGTCTGAACAWWRHMHGCGSCIGAGDAYVRHSHVGTLLATTKARQLRLPCASCNTSMPIAAFAVARATILHEGSLASFGARSGASPRSFLQGRHGLKPAPPHVGCLGS